MRSFRHRIYLRPRGPNHASTRRKEHPFLVDTEIVFCRDSNVSPRKWAVAPAPNNSAAATRQVGPALSMRWLDRSQFHLLPSTNLHHLQQPIVPRIRCMLNAIRSRFKKQGGGAALLKG